jgi:hypothetical protein
MLCDSGDPVRQAGQGAIRPGRVTDRQVDAGIAWRSPATGGAYQLNRERCEWPRTGRLVREAKARSLLQGTILTDVDETVAGIKRQHNVFKQLGIDPQEAFG